MWERPDMAIPRHHCGRRDRVLAQILRNVFKRSVNCLLPVSPTSPIPRTPQYVSIGTYCGAPPFLRKVKKGNGVTLWSTGRSYGHGPFMRYTN